MQDFTTHLIREEHVDPVHLICFGKTTMIMKRLAIHQNSIKYINTVYCCRYLLTIISRQEGTKPL